MTAGRQLLELSAAVLIGHTFRARHLNALFQQVQAMALELAEELLPQITTVTVDAAALRGSGTVSWSETLDLKEAITQAQEAPPFFIVLNPGDAAPNDAIGLQSELVVATRIHPPPPMVPTRLAPPPPMHLHPSTQQTGRGAPQQSDRGPPPALTSTRRHPSRAAVAPESIPSPPPSGPEQSDVAYPAYAAGRGGRQGSSFHDASLVVEDVEMNP